jgi:hypothetical protein
VVADTTGEGYALLVVPFQYRRAGPFTSVFTLSAQLDYCTKSCVVNAISSAYVHFKKNLAAKRPTLRVLIDNGVLVQRAPKPAPAKPLRDRFSVASPLFTSIKAVLPPPDVVASVAPLLLNSIDGPRMVLSAECFLGARSGWSPFSFPLPCDPLLHGANALPSPSRPCPSKPPVLPLPLNAATPTSDLDGECLRRDSSDIAYGHRSPS